MKMAVKNANLKLCLSLLSQGWEIQKWVDKKPYFRVTYTIGNNNGGFYSIHYKTKESLKGIKLIK